MFGCVHRACPGHDDKLDAILHGQQQLAGGQRTILRALRAIHTEQEHAMEEIDQELGTLEGDEQAEAASLATLSADETRELADLQSLKDAGQTLTPEQEERFAALDAKMQADKAAIDAEDAAINTADPAPAPPADGSGDESAPSDGDGTPDAGGDEPAPASDGS
jgi:hypothetical protein